MFKEGKTWHYLTLCQNLGYQFKDKKLLIQALTRTSSLVEGVQKDVGDFQRLEFLGDSVLGVVLAEVLFEMHPKWSEGELTSGKSKLVNNNGPLLKVAEHLQLADFLIAGNGERFLIKSGHEKILSDHVEAVIGAIFLDCGKKYKVIRKFVMKHWSAVGLLEADDEEFDNKSNLNLDPYVDLKALNQIIRNYTCVDYSKKQFNMGGEDYLDIALINAVMSFSGEEETIDNIEILLRGGANPNAEYRCFEEYWVGNSSCIGDRWTRSVLQLAVEANVLSTRLVKLLVEFGADPNWNKTILEKASSRPDPILLITKYPEAIDQTGMWIKTPPKTIKTKLTALHLLAERYLEKDELKVACEIVKILIEHKAKPLKTNATGKTAYAVRAGYQKSPYENSNNDPLTRLLRIKTLGEPRFPTRQEITKALAVELSGVFEFTGDDLRTNIDDVLGAIFK